MSNAATAIANEFIRRAKKSGVKLTHMQLQKLVYIAHGWSLTLFNEPLTGDVVQAWDYGPVFPSLYSSLKKYGTKPIDSSIREDAWDPFGEDHGEVIRAENLSEKQSKLLDEVWRVYGKFPAFKLSALTHKQNTPWSKVYKGGDGKGSVISDDAIQDHFNELADKPAA
ncbi:MAG: Panacea domain-containing protein [Hyphococcus sp.]